MDIISQITSLGVLEFKAFILVLCRVSGIFVDAPVFSNRNAPVVMKIGLIMFLSFSLFPLTKTAQVSALANDGQFIFCIIKEVMVGIIVGFSARLIFMGIQVAGQFIDYQMGFGFVNVIDPESRLQVPIIGQFLYIMGIFIFFLINGHHWILQSIAKSFEIVPLGVVHFKGLLVNHIGTLFSDGFVMGFKIAAPIAMSLFLVDLAYGVIARALPQANIMVVGFPIKIMLGFIFLLSSMPLFFMVMKRFFISSLTNLNALYRMM